MCNMVGEKNIRNYKQCFTHLLLFSLCAFLRIVFVFCVIVISYVFVAPYVYLLYLMSICCTLCVFVALCVYCCSYFRCWTAGQKSVSGRSCDRPPQHRFFLVSLCLQANAEMVPKFPSCYYMLLMQPFRLKFPSYSFFIFVYM